MNISVSEDQLKELLKSAIIEVLEERSDLLRDIVEEALEEVALAQAIAAGQQTEIINRDQVFSIFKDQK